MKVYVASSWRNDRQPGVVNLLREHGHEVYDFRNPAPGDGGFHWRAIDPDWESWDAADYREVLRTHPRAAEGFGKDHDAMEWAEVCVLVLPCGRSAHLEAGEFIGAGKRLVILLDANPEPELMYMGASSICISAGEVLEVLEGYRRDDETVEP